MFIRTLFFIFIFINVYASNNLNNTYYVDAKDINLSSIIPHVKNDIKLFSIEQNKHTKRVKSRDLIKKLKKHGHIDYKSKRGFISFVLKSPIDTSKIEETIRDYYLKKYTDIDIVNISVEPRSYLAKMPKDYVVNIRNRDYLTNTGTINIKTSDNKKIFFNYKITANILVYFTKNKIKKDVELSVMNVRQKSILFSKFRAKPIQYIQRGMYQAKHHIAKNKILTERDLETLSIVRRNSFVNVSLSNKNMAISFSAKALQDGKLNDIISVQKSNGKRLKVRVIGKNRVEMK